MRRAVAVAAATALAAGPTSAAAAQPAKAPQVKKRSGVCQMAFFQYKNLKGGRLCRGSGSDSNLANNHYDKSKKGMDNSISSVWVVAGKTDDGRHCSVTLYRYANYKGPHTTYTTTTEDKSLANNKVGDNRTSSYKFRCS